MNSNDDVLQVLVKFIIDEAKRDADLHETLRVALRQCSALVHGLKGDSVSVKRNNRTVSKSAVALLNDSPDFSTWHKNTINEHSMPINETWRNFRDNKNILDYKYIIKTFKDNLIVTVTKEEDVKLNKQKWSEDRYVEIDVLKLPETPSAIFKKR